MPTPPPSISGNGSAGTVSSGEASEAGPLPQPARRRSPVPLIIVAALFIIMPFLAWYFTWFGRGLSDDTINKYLADQGSPRHVQHALTQIEARIETGDQSVKRWYPQIVSLAGSDAMEIRQTVAWVMGQDNQAAEFHAALQRLLNDPEPIVRRNAALGITRFGDNSGRAELLAALEPFTVTAPMDATIISTLPVGSRLSVGAMFARLELNGSALKEMRAPLPGTIEKVFVTEGARVRSGDGLVSIGPDERSVAEALFALGFVGAAEDVATIEQRTSGMSSKLKEQAALTAKAIQSRTSVSQ